jgi:hypothetical protein
LKIYFYLELKTNNNQVWISPYQIILINQGFIQRKELFYHLISFFLRASDNSLQEIPFLAHHSSINRSSLAQVTQQWPPPFVLDQSPSFPISIAVQPTVATAQPKRHPLRRESTFPAINTDRRESSLWPFRTINAVFHKQTSEIKENDLFFSA